MFKFHYKQVFAIACLQSCMLVSFEPQYFFNVGLNSFLLWLEQMKEQSSKTIVSLLRFLAKEQFRLQKLIIIMRGAFKRYF